MARGLCREEQGGGSPFLYKNRMGGRRKRREAGAPQPHVKQTGPATEEGGRKKWAPNFSKGRRFVGCEVTFGQRSLEPRSFAGWLGETPRRSKDKENSLSVGGKQEKNEEREVTGRLA